jgi:hypothetical protein
LSEDIHGLFLRQCGGTVSHAEHWPAELGGRLLGYAICPVASTEVFEITQCAGVIKRWGVQAGALGRVGAEQKLKPTDTHTVPVLVQNVQRLFNRMTFREETWKTPGKDWGERLHAALQTWKLLDDDRYRFFVQQHDRQHYAIYDALVFQIYRYCDYLLASLHENRAGLNPLRAVAGNDVAFRNALPKPRSFEKSDEACAAMQAADKPRILAIHQMHQLLAAVLSAQFDTFLSYNSQDKLIVRQLADALVALGLRPWLDERELVPGRLWQEALEQIIHTTKTAVVLVGPAGLGPWEETEVRACLDASVKRKLPVIPVLLPGAPDLPVFLQAFTWVDLRGGLKDDGLNRLVWGITGQKPASVPSPAESAPQAPGTTQSERGSP